MKSIPCSPNPFFLFFSFIFLGIFQGISQTNELKALIYFDYNKAELSAKNQKTLDSLLQQIPANSNFTIQIIGHTDQHGNSEYNQQLSENRVQAVQGHFQKRNIPTERIETSAFGKTKLVTNNDEETERRLNRRAEIVIRFETPVSESVKPVEDTQPSIQELYDQLATSYQTFQFLPSKDSAYRCQDGTIFYFKANSFHVKSGQKNDIILIKIKEVFRYSDMLLENLSTMSEGKILETQGMFDVRAFDASNNELSLRSGKNYVAVVPVDEIKPNMQLFTGSWQNGQMNWHTVKDKNERIKGLGNFKLWTKKNKYQKKSKSPKNRGASRRGGGVNTPRGFNECFLPAPMQPEEKCSFFFCKIRNFISPKGNSKKGRQRAQKIDCDMYRSLAEIYGIQNMANIFDLINKPILDSINKLPEEKRADAWKQIAQKKSEDALNSEDGTTDNVSYLLFSNTSMRWANIDEFMSIPKDQLVEIKLPLAYNKSYDAKLLFKKRKVIYPAVESSGDFTFPKVLANEKAILVAFSYIDGKPKICIQHINTSDKIRKIEWEETTVAGLKSKLKDLDMI